MPGFRASAPAQNLGSFRATDWPTTSGAGPAMQSSPVAPPGQDTGAGPGGWHPTVLYLVGLVLVELAAYHLLSKHLNL